MIKYRDLSVTIVTIFSVGALFGFIGISEVLVKCLYGEDFEMSGIILRYLAFTLIFLGIGDVIRSQYLIPYRYDRVYIASAFLGAIVNVILNIVLIPKYQAIGAAIGTIGAEVVVFLYQIGMIRNSLPLLKYVKNLLLCGIAGILMLISIENINSDSSVIELVSRVIVGIFVYMAICSLLFLRTIRLAFNMRN